MSWPVAFRSDMTLRGLRVLVAEDSYLVAQNLLEVLEREGAEVIGPVATLEAARRLALETPSIDAAILDVNLRGEMIWPVADILSRRQVRLVFATGYAAAAIRQRYIDVRIAEKPAPAGMVARLVSMGALPLAAADTSAGRITR